MKCNTCATKQKCEDCGKEIHPFAATPMSVGTVNRHFHDGIVCYQNPCFWNSSGWGTSAPPTTQSGTINLHPLYIAPPPPNKLSLQTPVFVVEQTTQQ